MLGICSVRVNKEVPYCLAIQSVAAPRDDACNKAHTCLYLWIKHPTGHKLDIQARILVLQDDVFRVLKLTLHHRYIVSFFYSFVRTFFIIVTFFLLFFNEQCALFENFIEGDCNVYTCDLENIKRHLIFSELRRA